MNIIPISLVAKSTSKRSYVLGIVIPLLLAACQPETIVPKESLLPPTVQPHWENFEREARKRGIDVSLEGIEIYLTDGAGHPNTAGVCELYRTRNPRITIDTTSYNWQHSEWTREILLFHELGHSVLKRTHRDDRLPNGLYASMMRSTGDPLYGGQHNGYKRSYYLDELFEIDTPSPDWCMKDFRRAKDISWIRETILEDDFKDNQFNWPLNDSDRTRFDIRDDVYLLEVKDKGAYFCGKTIAFDHSRNFELSVQIRIEEGTKPTLLQWGGKQPEDMLYLGFTPDKYAFAGRGASGTFSGRQFIPIRPQSYNTLTVRKVDARYYLYINEQLFDTIDFHDFEGDLLGFYLGAQSKISIDYLHLSYLTRV